ncbi:MAG: chorismate synthase, partial [Campylobacterota bacterium]
MNRFGQKFSFTSFGESHGKAVGCVLEGVPAGLMIDEEF